MYRCRYADPLTTSSTICMIRQSQRLNNIHDILKFSTFWWSWCRPAPDSWLHQYVEKMSPGIYTFFSFNYHSWFVNGNCPTGYNTYLYEYIKCLVTKGKQILFSIHSIYYFWNKKKAKLFECFSLRWSSKLLRDQNHVIFIGTSSKNYS